jgi:16S rRNA (adenine1518-N6/adenine1519-N6)-dimethyltransferase
MSRARLGQHWLNDHRVCDQIAEAIALKPDETCIEIGGGKGALTKKLVGGGGASRLIVYEIDQNWAEHQKMMMPQWTADPTRVEVRQTDALAIDWSREALGLDKTEPLVIAGNIPYYITSPLFLALARSGLDFRRAIFLIQKEVAERVTAVPGDTEYGRLTVSLGVALATRTLFDVPPEAFKPPPKVMSTLIEMAPLPQPLITKEETDAFEYTVQSAFHMRRKTLVNNLRAGFPNTIDADILEILCRLELDPMVRAQDVSPAKFAELTRMLTAIHDITIERQVNI